MSAPTRAPEAPPQAGASRAPVRATLVAALICVPVLAPMHVLDLPAEPAAPVVPLASVARVVSVDQPAPAARPVGLAVPAIGLALPTLVDLGLDADGRLQAPEDFSQVGWWSGGTAPGDAGPAVLVGHVDSWQGPAVFFRVRDLRPGDEITVPRADGTAVTFVVDAVEQYAKDAFPADRVYAPTADAQLRLITCGGTFDRSARSYLDNIVVYASVR